MLAIRAQEEAGLDIITDGEIRRESYSNRFATALEGVDLDNPGTALDRSGHPNPVPRIVGKIRRKHAVEVDDLLFLQAQYAQARPRSRCPGPFTMSQQAQNDFYKSEEEAAMDYAAAVNEEIRDLFAAGADVVQIDEPYMQARPEKARQYGLEGAQPRARRRIQGTTAVHICFGYAAIIHQRPSGYSFLPSSPAAGAAGLDRDRAVESRSAVLQQLAGKKIMVGCIDLSDMKVETPQQVVGAPARALKHVRPEDVIVAPDCGMKYLPREVAFGKLQAMVEGAKLLRQEYS